MTCKTHR